ncbi:hypothetical protein ScPMuIL_004144 [Solemya velum]
MYYVMSFLHLSLMRCEPELQRNKADSPYHLFTTKAKMVPNNKSTDLTVSSPCQQEKTDTRTMIYFRHAADRDSFITISRDPTSLLLDSLHMRRLKRWIVRMYSENCSAESLNEVRKMMFTHGLKSLDSIPPTQNALLQHANHEVRMMYRGTSSSELRKQHHFSFETSALVDKQHT